MRDNAISLLEVVAAVAGAAQRPLGSRKESRVIAFNVHLNGELSTAPASRHYMLNAVLMFRRGSRLRVRELNVNATRLIGAYMLAGPSELQVGDRVTIKVLSTTRVRCADPPVAGAAVTRKSRRSAA